MNKTLISRSFENKASEITKDEFIDMMLVDVLNANVEYKIWNNEKTEERFQKEVERHNANRAKKIEEIIASSFGKYKREYYRQKWVESEIAKIPETISRDGYGFDRELNYLYWNIRPWSSMNGHMYIYYSKDLIKAIGEIYTESKNNKYFLNCTGWSIVGNSFKLHLSDEWQEKWDNDVKGMNNSVSRFYEGTKYWGD